jgi:hypothetical protein
MGVQSFDKIAFSREPNVGSVIIKIIEFASTVIVGFDPRIVEVGDLAIGMMHAGFFIKETIWIKTKGANGCSRLLSKQENAGSSFVSPSLLEKIV